MTNGLFYDSPSTSLQDRTKTALYTLKDQDTTHKGKLYPSLYRLYMEMSDLTEYNFAQKYVDGWEHWTILCASPFFKPYISRWRHELELKVRALALSQIESISTDPAHKAQFSACRFLLDGGWKTKEDQKTRGRPSKTEIQATLKTYADEERRLEEDFQRIN